MPEFATGRLRRLAEDLEESGMRAAGTEVFHEMLVEEIDLALRPPVHERRVASSGTILEPKSDPASWASGTLLDITRGPLGEQPLPAARRYADGLSSWLLRHTDHRNEWMVFDRPAGSERDLVVLADVLDATIVQRHPAGSVRVVGGFGVLRGRVTAGTTSLRSAAGSTPSPRVRSTGMRKCSRRCSSSRSTISDRWASARC